MNYAPTVIDRITALKLALEQGGIIGPDVHLPVLDEAAELLQKQHKCLMEWLRANGTGGWIDELRQAARAATTSPDANVEAVRTMLLERSVAGLAKYGVTTMRRDLTLREWQMHLLQELLDATIYLHRQMNYSESGSDDVSPIITRPEVFDVG